MFAAQNGNDDLKFSIGKGPQEDGHGRLVTGNYFAVLGVRPALGRTFTTTDDQSGNPAPVAVISHAFWTKRFGAAPTVIGQKIRVGEAELTIIGVAAIDFFGERVGELPDLWMPLELEPQIQPNAAFLKTRDMKWLAAMGRLKPAVSRTQAQASLNVLFQQIIKTEAPPKMSPEEMRQYVDQRIVLQNGARGISSVRAQFSEPLVVLMIAVGLVLLIACANVANLLLARATGRTKEISIRLALGAAASRLFRQLLAESVLYGLLGGLLGLWIAAWSARALLVLASQDGTPVPLDLHVDARVLAFTFGVSLLTGILFGAFPALAARKVDVGPALQKTSRGVMEGGGSRFTFRNGLVIAQVALSLLLLVGAGLFVRTLQNLSRTDLGYRRDHLLVVSLDFSSAGYKDERLAHLYKQLFETLNTMSGVTSATYSLNGIFSGSESNDEFTIQDYSAGRNKPNAFDMVGPGYFHTIGIQLLNGRDLKQSDDAHSLKVVVVNQAFARKFFPHSDPLGKWVRDENPEGSKTTFTIVGVAADAKDHSLRDKVAPRLFFPMLNSIMPPITFATVEIRTRQDPGTFKRTVQKAIASIDSTIPVENIRTVDEQVDRQLGTEKLIARLSALFSGLALLLAAVGLYGVIAYSVARRTAEMGVRLALGAKGPSLIWLVMRETLLLAAIGFAVGIPVSIATARLISSRLYGVESYDPATLVFAVLALALASGLAGFIPALRAARIDPLVALRWE